MKYDPTNHRRTFIAQPVADDKRPSTLPSPIKFLLLPRFTAIALFSAVEALRVANRYVPKPYEWSLMGLEGSTVADCNGIEVSITEDFSELTAVPGTILLVGGDSPDESASPQLFSRLRWLSSQGCLIGGIDTAQQLLAMGGLLDGYRVTVHWENASAFRERFRRSTLTVSLFEFDRNRVTCAGGTAGIDMVLEAVTAEHGRDIARRAAEHLMHGSLRRGAEGQRNNAVARWDVHNPKIAQSIELMESELMDPLSTSQIAQAVDISPRQLARLFREHLQTSPTQFYLELRLENAHRMLLHSDLQINDVSQVCGFQSQSHFSRVYRAKYGVPPSQTRYRVVKRQFPVMQPSALPRDHRPVSERTLELAPACPPS